MDERNPNYQHTTTGNINMNQEATQATYGTDQYYKHNDTFFLYSEVAYARNISSEYNDVYMIVLKNGAVIHFTEGFEVVMEKLEKINGNHNTNKNIEQKDHNEFKIEPKRYLLTDFTTERWKGVNLDTIRKEIERLKKYSENGRFVGELSSPIPCDDQRVFEINLGKVSHMITNIALEDGKVYGDIRFLDKHDNGRLVISHIKENQDADIKFSIRAVGTGNNIYTIITWDLVFNSIYGKNKDECEIEELIEIDNDELMSMSLNEDIGSIVKFVDKGGYDCEREEANKELNTRSIYTVAHMNVGRSSSTVTLKETGKFYNTCMFRTVKQVGDRDWFGESYPCFARNKPKR